MPRRMTRERRRAAFLEQAGAMWDRIEAWYDAHPEASFGDLESEVRKERRELMGPALGVLVNGRDLGSPIEKPRCSRCGREMTFEAYRPWEVHGLEGDTQLERAYYVCPECHGETIFPLGS